jgi:hypothetical protein
MVKETPSNGQGFLILWIELNSYDMAGSILLLVDQYPATATMTKTYMRNNAGDTF